MKFKEFLRKYAFRIIVFIIMVGFLVYFFYGLDLQGSYEILKEASVLYLLIALLFMLISAAVKAYRFFILLKPKHPELKFTKFILPYLVGYGFSVLGPFKTGELASVEINKRNLGVSRSSSFAALAFFRVVDVVIVLVFFILALGLTVPTIITNTTNPELASKIQFGTNIVFYLAITGTVVLTAILFIPQIGRFFLKITTKVIGKISEKAGSWLNSTVKPALNEYYESLKFLYSKVLIASIVIITTVLRWILEFYSLKFTMMAFGSDISLINAASVMSIALLIGLITFVPAGIGTGTITTQVLLLGLVAYRSIVDLPVLNLSYTFFQVGMSGVVDTTILYQAFIGIILTLLLAAIASPFLKEKKTEEPQKEQIDTSENNETESES